MTPSVLCQQTPEPGATLVRSSSTASDAMQEPDVPSCEDERSSQCLADVASAVDGRTDIVARPTDSGENSNITAELKEEIMHFSQSLTELSRRLDSANEANVSENCASSSSNSRTDKELADKPESASPASSSGLEESSFCSSDGSVASVCGEAPACGRTVGANSNGFTSKVSIAQQLCHNACGRLSSLMYENKAGIIAMLTKSPIRIDFAVQCDGEAANTGSSEVIAAAVEQALSQNVKTAEMIVVTNETADFRHKEMSSKHREVAVSVGVVKTSVGQLKEEAVQPVTLQDCLSLENGELSSDAKAVEVLLKSSVAVSQPVNGLQDNAEYIPQGTSALQNVSTIESPHM